MPASHSIAIDTLLKYKFVFACAGIIIAAIILGLTRPTDELAVYTLGGERLVGGEQIYRPDDPPAFTYPPFCAMLFTPFVPMTQTLRQMVWWAVNLTLLTVVITLLTRAAWPIITRKRATKSPPIWLNTLIIGILAGRFILSPLEYQSTDLIILACIVGCGYWLAKQQDGWSGMLAAVATACKATPLLLLPMLIWQRRITASIVFVAVLLGATFLPDFLFPSNDGGTWAGHWYQKFVAKVDVGESPEAEGAWAAWNPLNQSLSGTIYRLTSPTPPNREAPIATMQMSARGRKITTLSIEAALLLFLAWIAWPSNIKHAREDLRPLLYMGQVGCASCGMLLLSPMSSTQHFCALIIPITFCVTYWLYERRSKVVSVALVSVLFLGPLAAQDICGDTISDALQVVGGTTFCTSICLVASGYVLVTAARHHPAATVDQQRLATHSQAEPRQSLTRRAA